MAFDSERAELRRAGGPSAGDGQVSDDWVVVLAKAPLCGEAKTRLARDVGPDRARTLAEAFLVDTLALVQARSAPRSLVAFTPEGSRAWFERHAPWAVRRPQGEGDLGARIGAALRAAFDLGARRCVVIGTDTPHLPPERLDEAFEALDGADVCLGPSRDGGYYLIGLRADCPRLFEDVPWSSALVRDVTLERARECALRVRELPVELDVDRGPDLELLLAELQARPTAAPATRAALLEGPGRSPAGAGAAPWAPT